MRTNEEDMRVGELLREYDEAVQDEIDAASRVASAKDELADLGVDVEARDRANEAWHEREPELLDAEEGAR